MECQKEYLMKPADSDLETKIEEMLRLTDKFNNQQYVWFSETPEGLSSDLKS